MNLSLKLTANSLSRALTQLTKTPAFDDAMETAANEAADRLEPSLAASGSDFQPRIVSSANGPVLKAAATDAAIVREVLT
ncbi:hypothetical protein [Ahrensia sp. R2A130]|uniref:hypothetical protein n=1 Tax=Ahrensia sp. R2A130 TaxID=744979 RepID=UPI0001E0E8C0|nr:hypothetical protein [Ahrensia sp. R2A130]EFL88958.1 outer membrane protein [Ahrensia sp. R2A130]